MRDIKFKAISIMSSKWVYGFYSAVVDSEGRVIHYISDESLIYEVIGDTVSQWTSFISNNRELYDNDIVKVSPQYGKGLKFKDYYGIVLFDKGSFFIKALDVDYGNYQLSDEGYTLISSRFDDEGKDIYEDKIWLD